MNYYHCYGFSELNGDQQEIDILVANEDINKARMIASWYVTNISHFDEYPINPKEFGTVQFIIRHEGEMVEIISSLNTIKEAFKILSDTGMDIMSVNSLDHPLKPYLQKIIRGMLRKEFGISNDDPFTLANEDEDPVEGQDLTPTQLIRITNLITHILADSKELYIKSKSVLEGENMIAFTKAIQLLQETLNQGDIMSAKEQTKRLITLMEKVESEYIDFERARDHHVESQIIIPNLNTILSHNQWVTADKLYELKAHERSKIEQRYETIYHKIFEKWALYLRGIWAEFRTTVGMRGDLIIFFTKKIEYTLISLSLIITILLRLGAHHLYWGGILYVIGFIGIAIQCSHFLPTRRILVKLSMMGVSCSVRGLIGYLIASNLALI